jgi:hypothetical protein
VVLVIEDVAKRDDGGQVEPPMGEKLRDDGKAGHEPCPDGAPERAALGESKPLDEVGKRVRFTMHLLRLKFG